MKYFLRGFSIVILLNLLLGCKSQQIREEQKKTPRTVVDLQLETETPQLFFISDANPKAPVTKNMADLMLEAIGDRNQRLYFIGSSETFQEIKNYLVLKKTPQREKFLLLESQPADDLGEKFTLFQDPINEVSVLAHQNAIDSQVQASELAEVIAQAISKRLSTKRKMVKVSVDFFMEAPKEPINQQQVVVKNGRLGGNFERWPFQLGVIGSSDFPAQEQFDEFTRRVFSEKIIVTPVNTTWLKKGQVNEVVKAVQLRQTKTGCSFDLLIASPRRALALLEKFPRQDFLQLPEGGAGKLFQKFCGKIGRAGADCAKLDNGEVLDFIKQDDSFKLANDLAVQHLSEFQRLFNARIGQRCEANWIELPTLYMGDVEMGAIVSRSVVPIFPALASSILIGQTAIFPPTYQRNFQQELTLQLRKIRFRTEFLDLEQDLWQDGDRDVTRSLQNRIQTLRQRSD